MNDKKKKMLYLPEATVGEVIELEEECCPDSLIRPDILPETEETDSTDWALPEQPTEPCPCCGADIPENPWPGYICPTCWWEIDPFVSDETEPSDLNHGLSLEEAQTNFRVFGICDPDIRR